MKEKKARLKAAAERKKQAEQEERQLKQERLSALEETRRQQFRRPVPAATSNRSSRTSSMSSRSSRSSLSSNSLRLHSDSSAPSEGKRHSAVDVEPPAHSAQQRQQQQDRQQPHPLLSLYQLEHTKLDDDFFRISMRSTISNRAASQSSSSSFESSPSSSPPKSSENYTLSCTRTKIQRTTPEGKV